MTTAESTPYERRQPSKIDTPLGWLSALLAVAVTSLVVVGLLATLAYALAPAFGYKLWMIDGGSMEPTIPDGSLVISHHADEAEFQALDIITFRPPDATVSVTHRITDLREVDGHLLVTTQGDANQNPDPVQVELAGGADRVAWTLPYAGRAVGFARGTSGLMLFLVAPALLLAVFWLRDDDENGEEAGQAEG